MQRIAVASFVLIAAGCAKHMAKVEQASLIGSWSSTPDINPRKWDRWTFRPDGTAEWRTHLQFGPEQSTELVFGGPYQLTKDRLTVTMHRMDMTIDHPEYEKDGDVAGMKTGNIATFKNIRLENGNLVSKNFRGGGDSVLYPWRG